MHAGTVSREREILSNFISFLAILYRKIFRMYRFHGRVDTVGRYTMGNRRASVSSYASDAIDSRDLYVLLAACFDSARMFEFRSDRGNSKRATFT